MNFLKGIEISETPNTLIIKQRAILPIAVSILALCIGVVVLGSATLSGENAFSYSYFSTLVGILAPILIILSNRRMTKFITIVLDKNKNALRASSLYFGGRELKEYALNEIAAIKLYEEHFLAKGGVREAARIFYIILVMKDGQEIRLPEFPSFLYNKRRVILEKTLGEQIAHFLSVPFREDLRG